MFKVYLFSFKNIYALTLLSLYKLINKFNYALIIFDIKNMYMSFILDIKNAKSSHIFT